MALDHRAGTMTITLRGRWTSRLFLAATVGVLATLPFCLLTLSPLPLVVLGWVVAVGLVADVWYDRRQRFRWDHDWPVHAQIGAGLLEGALSALSLLSCCCAGGWVFGPAAATLAIVFPFHYATVWTAMFLTAQGPLRAMFPYARFHGGRIF